MGTRLDEHNEDAVPAESPLRGELHSVATIDEDQDEAAAEREPGTVLQTSSDVTDAPPFWSTSRHRRTTSSASYQSLNQTRPAAIVLEDHSKDDDEQALSCWAQSVTIDDYSVVSGPSGIGAYVVWHLTVGTLKGGDMPLNKRYFRTCCFSFVSVA